MLFCFTPYIPRLFLKMLQAKFTAGSFLQRVFYCLQTYGVVRHAPVFDSLQTSSHIQRLGPVVEATLSGMFFCWESNAWLSVWSLICELVSGLQMMKFYLFSGLSLECFIK